MRRLSSRVCLCLCLILSLAANLAAQETQPRRYLPGPDSERHADVPRGTVTEFQWLESELFPGTKRRYYLYVPQQYDADKAAALMVFQDGHAYLGEEGQYRACAVMDNLIARGEMPVTIGLFVDPGHLGDLPDKPGWRPRPANRSLEYDTLSDAYARFLIEELLPQVTEKYNISKDPARRAICGASSGGICAFTAAWHRPDQFGKVISHIGSFTNIRHGDTYPGLIRKTEAKPIRVYLQDGSNDLDNQHGNWPLANQQMAAALRFKGYDVKFDFGEGAHDGNHGGSLLPDALRWTWRDDPDVEARLALIPEIQTAEWAQAWWMPRHELKLAHRKVMPDAEILFVGDSITHGWENAGQEVLKKYFGDRRILNLGFSGDRTEHVLWRFQNGEIDDIQPKLAVVMIGTNNTGHRQEAPERTAEGVERIVDRLHRQLPDCKVLLLAVFPRGASADDRLRKINDGINERIAKLAEQPHVWYLDLKDQFLDAEGNLPKEIMPDRLHPNAEGYRIWAEAMKPMIDELAPAGS